MALRTILMSIEDFLLLPYSDQLKLISASGRLKSSQIVNGYQITLYKVKGFYVELKRNIHELSFEKITAINNNDVPEQYQ